MVTQRLWAQEVYTLCPSRPAPKIPRKTLPLPTTGWSQGSPPQGPEAGGRASYPDEPSFLGEAGGEGAAERMSKHCLLLEYGRKSCFSAGHLAGVKGMADGTGPEAGLAWLLRDPARIPGCCACWWEGPGKRLGLGISWAWVGEGHSGSLGMDRF